MEKSNWMRVERGHWLGKWEATGDFWMKGGSQTTMVGFSGQGGSRGSQYRSLVQGAWQQRKISNKIVLFFFTDYKVILVHYIKIG